MRGETASVNKFTPPRIVGYLPRRKLFCLLDAARRRPVVWISAPAGSGKTTLVDSYIEGRGLPCLWYKVDAGDADPGTFLSYLGLAGRRANPRKRKPLPLLTPEYLPDLSVFSLRYFERLYERLKPGSVLVFDNCQKVPQDSAVHDVLREGLSTLPKGLGAILMSRSDPPPAFARSRAHQLMEVVGWKELRLTPEETEGIARLRWKGKVPKETVRALHGRTGGWAAGLVLLLEQTASKVVEPRRLKERSPEELFDYFGEEVFEGLEEAIRLFLLRSAFLPRLSVAMAESLTGEPRAGQILSYLHRHNIFTTVDRDGELAYEYHALFREFLLTRAKSALPAEEISRLQRAAAGLLAERGQVEDAVLLLRECGAWGEVCRLILSQAPVLVAQGRFQTLGEWIRFFPQDVLENVPWLRYWRGVSGLLFEPGESRGHFEESFRKFREQGDVVGVFLSWCGVVDSIVYGFKDFRSLCPWLAVIDDVLEEFGGFPSKEIEERFACSIMKAIGFFPGGPVRSGEDAWVERALSVARTSPDVLMKCEALTGLFHYFQGRSFQKGEMALNVLRESTEHQSVPPMAKLQLFSFDSAHAIVAGEYDRCRNAVADGVSFAAGTGVRHWDYILMGQGALCSMITGDSATAKDLLRKMAVLLGTAKPHAAGFYHYLAAWHAMADGDLAKAHLHSEQCRELSEETGYCWTMHLACYQSAFVHFASGSDRSAADRLRSARGLVPGERCDYPNFACGLAEAYFLLRKGEEEAALAPLRAGLQAGREAGLGGVYMWHPGFLELVAAKALEAGIEVEYVRELIRKNRLAPGDAQLGLEQWPWPVKISTLGRFEILKDEKPLEYSRKAQQKPLQMLKTMIALGGRDVAEERIADLLWPDSEGDLAHQAFATTLRRLRRLLGEEKALVLREGRLTLSDRHCHVDAWTFERLIEWAEKTGGEGERGDGGAESIRLLEKAIALYKGPFLSEELKHPWAVSLRERLRSKFLRGVGTLGRHRESAGDLETAIACYRRGLEVDNLAEEFYRCLMVCYKRLGRDAEAQATYDACRKILSGTLGVPPSPKTVAVYRAIFPSSPLPL